MVPCVCVCEENSLTINLLSRKKKNKKEEKSIWWLSLPSKHFIVVNSMCLSVFCCCRFVCFSTTLFHKLINQTPVTTLPAGLSPGPQHPGSRSTVRRAHVCPSTPERRCHKPTRKSPPPYLQVFLQVHNTQGLEALCVDSCMPQKTTTALPHTHHYLF